MLHTHHFVKRRRKPKLGAVQRRTNVAQGPGAESRRKTGNRFGSRTREEAARNRRGQREEKEAAEAGGADVRRRLSRRYIPHQAS